MLTIPQQPFGFVAGRWVLSMADTPVDADRAPDYKPLDSGTVIFKNKLSHRVVSDGQGGSIGIVKTRYEGKINENGQLVDAEGNEFVALPVGVYTVSFSFGQYSWPQFDFELKAEHTLEAPFWLPSESPIPSGPGVVHVVSEEARLAAEAAAASAWEAVDTPGRQGIQGIQGIQGPPGDLDAEHLAGAPRLKNLVHNITWTADKTTIDSQTPRLAKFTATARLGHIRWNDLMLAGKTYYLSAEVKTTSKQVFFGSSSSPVYHSGSGDWERLTGLVIPTGGIYYQVRDNRYSGWDQIEVRDPVLIDLTAVFGAGREPTKEYMDALLAKHGNYIGAADPFVVGDALHALTLAGQGITVSVDTSVGTRVMLDHPGGSIMLYGATPVIDALPLLINGWKQWESFDLSLYRINNRVYLEGMVDGSDKTSDHFLSIPEGFRPYKTPIYPGSVLNYSTLSPQKFIFSTSKLATLYQSKNVAGQYNVSISWGTLDGWPIV